MFFVLHPDAPEVPRRPAAPALAPTIPLHGPVSPELDAVLSALGCRAAAGDTDALNALYAAYAPRLGYWVHRAQRLFRRYGIDRALEPEDIAQQAYLVFADLVRAWEDDQGLSRYVFAYFPWRLSDTVRKMSERRVLRTPAGLPALLLADDSAAAAEAIALLEALADDLPDREGRVLLLRIRDGLPWDEVARLMGVERRTVFRIWKRVLGQLRASLDLPGSGVSR
jgi:RNA polymerase sigma factor (sigma-70 family)